MIIKKESEKALFFIVEKEYISKNIVHIINKEETHFIYFSKLMFNRRTLVTLVVSKAVFLKVYQTYGILYE